MKAFIISAALLGTLIAMPAYAFQCPGDVAKIDAALKAGPNVSAEQLAEAKKLRAEGGNCIKAVSMPSPLLHWPKPRRF